MCGRFTLTVPSYGELAKMLQAESAPALAQAYSPRYNIAPTDIHPILCQDDKTHRLMPGKWGLTPSWTKDEKTAFRFINARAETAAEKPTFRKALKERRCIIPADGFYEWSGEKGKKTPFWIHPKAEDLLLFAGLYEDWRDFRTFTILTTSANQTLSPIHHRMPVILANRQINDWLSLEDPVDMMIPANDDLLETTEVSKRVNSVAHDDADCLKPVGR